MAERPGELNNEVDLEKNTSAVVVETPDNVSLTDRPAEITTDAADTADVKDFEDPDRIRENIEETRAEMSETIDAIQERLSFSNVSEQVKAEVSDYVGETIQTVKDNIYGVVFEKGENFMKYVDKGMNELADTKAVKTAKRNPLALSLIGLGLGMLYYSSGGSSKKRTKFRYDYDEDYDYDRNERNYGRGYSSKNNQSTLDAAQSKISGAAGAVSDSVSSAAGAVSDSVSSAAGAVSDTVGSAANKTYKTVSSKAEDFVETAQNQYDHYMEENPLAVGAVAMALGAAVGMVLPSTRIEGKYMGEARNNLLQKAEETARDAVGKVQKVAGEVSDTVKTEAKNQGLT